VVRDKRHTLARVVDPLLAVGGVYIANLTGPRALSGGNLNDDGAIDLLDFAEMVVAAGSNYGTGDTTCATAAPHADISGDGVAFAADFSFIAANLNQTSDPPCCGAPLHDGGPVHSITVEELKARGMSHLTAADVNGDGVLDRRDFEAFANGRK
jgi:hypothetical protein